MRWPRSPLGIRRVRRVRRMRGYCECRSRQGPGLVAKRLEGASSAAQRASGTCVIGGDAGTRTARAPTVPTGHGGHWHDRFRGPPATGSRHGRKSTTTRPPARLPLVAHREEPVPAGDVEEVLRDGRVLHVRRGAGPQPAACGRSAARRTRSPTGPLDETGVSVDPQHLRPVHVVHHRQNSTNEQIGAPPRDAGVPFGHGCNSPAFFDCWSRCPPCARYLSSSPMRRSGVTEATGRRTR